jgi:PTH1 family peptidyl-tRNA hydrolase
MTLRWLQRHGARQAAPGTRLVVGLGNPGTRYARNRHNVGFRVVEEFGRAHAFDFARKKFNAQIAEGASDGARVLIAKPQTYMNASGEAVSKLCSFYKIASQDLLVVYDDLDLPLGKLRLRGSGSAGGHHGMESIIAHIGTSDFPRLRVGIGRPSAATRAGRRSNSNSTVARVVASRNLKADVDHVLGDFEGDEGIVAEAAIARAVEAIDVWIEDGIEKAMNKFNQEAKS